LEGSFCLIIYDLRKVLQPLACVALRMDQFFNMRSRIYST
jgi:hypothetical protein